MSIFSKRALARLGVRFLETLNNRKVPEAPDSERLNGKTPEQVMAQVTKTTVGLSQLEDRTIATQVEAEAGTSDTTLSTPLTVKQYMNKRLELDSNERGVCAGFLSGTQKFKTTKLCRRMNVVNSQEEQDLVVNAKESFADVFNNWTRTSHGNSYKYPHNPVELDKWEYNESTDTIRATVNSSSYIGFISAESFEDYDLEVELSSINGDDDRIGLVLAFVQANGRQYALTVFRQFDGYENRAASFIALYNAFQPDRITLEWNDADLGDPNPYHNAQGTIKTGWAGVGKVRLRIRRRGDVFECWTTLPNETTYLENKKITIDLNSRPELGIFKGPQRFGYSCQSQLYASWRSIERPGERWPIIRTDTLDTYLWQSGTWVKQPAGTHRNYIDGRKFYTNQITKKLFFALTQDIIAPIVKENP